MRGAARKPVLVTGVPRSGTTWLARWLAMGRGMALAGREPMNPRGRNYALGGTLPGWARLQEPTARQRRALVSSYLGLNPLVYSRYGARQWAAPLPWTRLVVKDPFAVLSIPAIARLTGALPVLVYRHPAAVLTSYRRMGWRPDLDELRPIMTAAAAEGVTGIPELPPQQEADTAHAMGAFWAALHQVALADLERTGTEVVVVAHQELAASGASLGRRLADRLHVAWSPEMERELTRDSGAEGSSTALHNFARSPAEVADAWRSRLDPAELEAVEKVAGDTLRALDERRQLA